MANSPSARKRIRQTARRTERKVARRSRARRFVRLCEDSISAAAQPSEGKESTRPSPEEALKRATSELHRAAQKGAMHKKAVSRKISRLARRLLAQTRKRQPTSLE